MLVRKIEIFLRRTGLSATRFGRLAVGDPSLVRGLREGRIPRPRMEQRVEHFMNAYEDETDAS